jgi:predicted alpha/beta-fold hydrolase
MKRLPLHNSAAILGTILAILLPFMFFNAPNSVQAATENITANVQIQTPQPPVTETTTSNQSSLRTMPAQPEPAVAVPGASASPANSQAPGESSATPTLANATQPHTNKATSAKQPLVPPTDSTDPGQNESVPDQYQPTDTATATVPGKTAKDTLTAKSKANDSLEQPTPKIAVITAKTDQEVPVAQTHDLQNKPDHVNTVTSSTADSNDTLTLSAINQSMNQTIRPRINGLIGNLITDITSFSGAAAIYPFAFTRASKLVGAFRALLSANGTNIDQTWSNLDQKYDPKYSKAFYTEAKNWYDHQAPKETWAVPFYDDPSKSVRATYLKHNDSTKTVIYGQGWTTEPEWMGYISKVFYDLGYNVLITYSRGQYTSDGNFITFGTKDKYDWQEWIKKVDAKNGPTSKVVLYGQSMGAATVLETAAVPKLSPSVKAVVADCSFSTMPALAYSLYERAANTLNKFTSKIGIHLNGQIPLLPFNKVLTAFSAINHFFQGNTVDDCSSITAVKNSKVPTLFISTTDDGFIPCTETAALYKNSMATDKALWLLDGKVGGHAAANNAVLAYQQHIKDFLTPVIDRTKPMVQPAAA